jgi:hypothetical protein
MAKNAQEIIGENNWAICKICKDEFGRKRETLRYCKTCKNGFCEGEHGVKGYGGYVCLTCKAK